MHENFYKLSRVDSLMYVTIAFATSANYLSRWGQGSLQLLPIALRLTIEHNSKVTEASSSDLKLGNQQFLTDRQLAHV